MVIKAIHIWIWTAFSEVPTKDFIFRFCLIILKVLCKALHKMFRLLKSDLDLRPIYHQKDESTMAHLIIMAQLHNRYIRNDSRYKNWGFDAWDIGELRELKLTTIFIMRGVWYWLPRKMFFKQRPHLDSIMSTSPGFIVLSP